MTAHNRPFWRRLAQAAAQPATAATAASAHTAPAGLASAMRPLALEQRFMFDGAGAVDAAHAAADTGANDANTGGGGAESAAALRHALSTETEKTAEGASAATVQRQEVVFVDSQVPNLAELLAGLSGNAEVVVLDAGNDGLQQMADYLQGRSGLDAIHLLSHGADGTVQMGNVWLSSANLAEHSAALQSIGAALKADGDLLLYGCDVGQGDKGQSFLDQLAAITGADVAASADATGAASLGGNWALETRVGTVEADQAISQSNVSGYDALLANTSPSFVGATTRITTTQNGTAIDLRSLLLASDTDTGQTLVWSRETSPSNGMLVLINSNAASGGTSITSGGSITYTPFTGFAGLDAFTVKVSDGTTYTTRVITVEVTPIAPGAPGLSPGSDLGSSSSDRITSADNLTFLGTSAVGDNMSTVRVFIDVNNNGIFDTGDSSATAFLENDTWTVSGVSTAGLNGTYNVYAQVSAGSLISPLSPARTVTIDKTAPGAPTNSILVAVASDSGSSSTDRVTNVTNPLLRLSLAGTSAVAGDSVELLLNGSSFNTPVLATLTSTNIANGYYDVTLTSGSLGADGTKVLTNRVIDIAGNIGAAGGTLTLVLDTTAPGAPTNPILVAVASDSGSSSTDRVTNVTNPLLRLSLAGTNAVVGDSLELLLGGSSFSTPVRTTLTSTNIANGYYDVTLTSGSLGADGIKVLTSRVTDIAGNVGMAGGTLTLVIDTTKPATPPAPTLDLASDGGLQDGVTNVVTPVINGTAETGSFVTLYDTDGITILGTTTATDGVWSITSSALAQGAHSLSVKAKDVAGNESDASEVLVVNIETVDPTVLSVVPPADGSYKAGAVLTFTVNASESVVLDTTSGTPRLVLDVGGVTRYADYVSGAASGALQFRYTVQAGDNAANGLVVGTALDLNGSTARDAAGNSLVLGLNNMGSTNGVRIDTEVPSATLSLDKTTLNAQQTAQLTVRFSEAVTGLDVSDFTVTDGTLSGLVSKDGGITWTVTLTPVQGKSEANLQIALNNAGYTDLAGNAGVQTSWSDSYAIDTVLPAQPVLQVESNAAGSATVRVDALQAGAQWEYSLDSGQTWQAGQGATVAIASPGQYVLQARQTSAAGNHSEVAMLSVDVAPLLIPTSTEWPMAEIFGQRGTGAPPMMPPISVVPYVLDSALPIVPRGSGNFFWADHTASGDSFSATFFSGGVATDGNTLSHGFLGFGRQGDYRGGDVSTSSRVIPISAATDSPLVVLYSVDAVVAGADRQVDWKVPATLFGHSDPLERVQLSMTQADGKPLPTWLKFDARTGQLSGTMPPGYHGEISLSLTARDSQGRTVNTTIQLQVGDVAPAARVGMAEQLQRHAQLRAGQMAAQRLHL